MDGLVALFQVIVIDLVLAGDNAIVIGALAANLPDRDRGPAMVFGIAAAIGLRLFFSLSAAWLLLLPGLGIIGGCLLLYIAWRLWKDSSSPSPGIVVPAGLMAAIGAIAAADLSMSIDNILGVAGAARGHYLALIVGLVGSMVIMGFGANWVAGQMKRLPWLIYVGIGAIAAAGLNMIVSPVYRLGAAI